MPDPAENASLKKTEDALQPITPGGSRPDAPGSNKKRQILKKKRGESKDSLREATRH